MFKDKHILLADHQPDDLHLLIAALRNTRCRISIVFDGEQAYHRAQAQTPDLIVMEVKMPRMDGLSACRLLAATPATQAIPVILLTSADDLATRLDGFDSGAIDYVTKPYEPAEVIARIRVHMNRSVRPPVNEFPDLGHSADASLVRAALQFLSANLSRPPSLDHLAKRLGTHEKRLSRAFREYIGKSVFEHVREKRLDQAQYLLSCTSLSIAAIADETGFSSAANFATVFRRQFIKTPSEYRRDKQQSRPGHAEPVEPTEE
jgi:DNA-binding response OmpR family regulator